MSSPEPDESNRPLAMGMALALAASGRTRQDIALEAGISTTHVTKLLMGTVNPSQRVLFDLAKAVNHSVDEIYRLGREAIEREEETAQRQALRRAKAEVSVDAVAEVALRMDLETLGKVIQRLRQIEAERRETETA